VPQEIKFSPVQTAGILQLYAQMIAASPADLVVTSETALPVYLHQLPSSYLKKLEMISTRHGSTLALGIPFSRDVRHYTNSVVVMSPDSTAPHHLAYHYDKQHLVPFGEFIPTGFRWFVQMMRIPLGDFDRGAIIQSPFRVKEQWVLPNICYEDIFGEEIARQIKAAREENRPEPGILLNLSNIAWFGDSLALPQHLQISRMRAMEMRRPMIRATNTGATAVIDRYGRVEGLLPFYTRATLAGEVSGYNGYTPYVYWGNTPVILLCVILISASVALCLLRGRGRQPL
ncbi:MAG: apolipoprotein N-acyltransferase, partial [Burkholderiaceae bacterium]|jgi:apolipoprotein N-acyltransferase|nr:apolipoprotein N-acyltransferase [Burkholderiaceae bacterium]